MAMEVDFGPQGPPDDSDYPDEGWADWASAESYPNGYHFNVDCPQCDGIVPMMTLGGELVYDDKQERIQCLCEHDSLDWNDMHKQAADILGD